MNTLRHAIAGAALAATPLAASAGVIFIPITEVVAEAPGDLTVEPTAPGGLVARTRGAQSRLTGACGGTGTPGAAGLVVETQSESLRITPSGAIDGRLRARMTQPDTGRQWDVDAFVSGTAICQPGATGGCRPLAIRATAVGPAMAPAEPRSLLQFEIQLLRVGTAGADATAAQWQSEVAAVRLTGSPATLRDILGGLEAATCTGPIYPGGWED